MLVASIPAKFNFVWGYGASNPTYIRSIPQTTSTPGAASLQLGYPPITFTPLTAGGIAPDGADENGILNQITLWLQWIAGGGAVFYDAAWSTANGGYAKWAVLANAATVGLFWISTVDNNTSDPDTGGANWMAFPSFQTASTAADVQAGASGANKDTRPVTPDALALSCGFQLLTDASTVAWNAASGYNAELTFTAGVGSSRIMGAPSNLNDGQTYMLDLVQGAGGGFTISSWNAVFDFGTAGVPTLSTGAGLRDTLGFQYRAGSLNKLKYLGIGLGF